MLFASSGAEWRPSCARAACRIEALRFLSRCAQATAYNVLPSLAPDLHYLRCSGDLDVHAAHILAIGAPKPLLSLPRAVRDPSGRARALLPLAQVDDTTFIAHPGGRRRSSVCMYPTEDLLVVRFPDGPLAADGDVSQVVRPDSLAQVNSPSPPDLFHSSLRIAQIVAGCHAEIHAARVSDRPADFSSSLNMDAFSFADEDLNRKFVFVWRDHAGAAHVRAGPCLFTLMQHMSGAPASAPSASQTSSD